MTEFEKTCTRCGKQGHLVSECPQAREGGKTVALAKSVQFQFIKLNVVREYLYLEFSDMQLPFGFDFERILDDFIFLCFFMGNDFLPHSPSLHIREGAIDAVMALYKQQLPYMGGYLTDGQGKIDFSRLDVILNDIAKIEEVMIKQKKEYEERQKNFPGGGGAGGQQR